MGHEWVSYRVHPKDPRSVVEHFGGIVLSGPVEPRPERPKRSIRDFRGPENLGVFFHPWCAPRIKLPEKVQEEFARFLAGLRVADYEKRTERWATVAQLGTG